MKKDTVIYSYTLGRKHGVRKTFFSHETVPHRKNTDFTFDLMRSFTVLIPYCGLNY